MYNTQKLGNVPRLNSEQTLSSHVEPEPAAYSVASSIYQWVVSNIFPVSYPSLEAVPVKDMAINSMPALIGQGAEEAITYGFGRQLGGNMLKGLAKVGGGGGQAVANLLLSPSYAEVENQCFEQLNESLKQEVDKQNLVLANYLQNALNISETEQRKLEEVSEKLKKLYLQELRAKEVFSQKLLHYINFDLSERECQKWYKEVDKAVAFQKSLFQERTEKNESNITSKWSREKERVEKLQNSLQTSIPSLEEEDRKKEITKEFVRGGALGLLDVFVNSHVLKNAKVPGSLLGLISLHVLLSAGEVLTNPTGRIMKIQGTEEGVSISQNTPLEFMKRLVNSIGVAGIGILASAVIPQLAGFNLLRTTVSTILLTSTAGGVAELLNPTRSDKDDIDRQSRDVIENNIQQDLEKVSSKLLNDQQEMNTNEARAILNALTRLISNSEIVAILQEEIHSSYPEKQEINQNPTDELSKDIPVSPRTTEQEEFRNQIIIFALQLVLISIFASIYGDKSKETEDNKTETQSTSKDNKDSKIEEFSPFFNPLMISLVFNKTFSSEELRLMILLIRNNESFSKTYHHLVQNFLKEQKRTNKEKDKNILNSFEASILEILKDSSILEDIDTTNFSHYSEYFKAIQIKKQKLFALSEQVKNNPILSDFVKNKVKSMIENGDFYLETQRKWLKEEIKLEQEKENNLKKIKTKVKTKYEMDNLISRGQNLSNQYQYAQDISRKKIRAYPHHPVVRARPVVTSHTPRRIHIRGKG